MKIKVNCRGHKVKAKVIDGQSRTGAWGATVSISRALDAQKFSIEYVGPCVPCLLTPLPPTKTKRGATIHFGKGWMTLDPLFPALLYLPMTFIVWCSSSHADVRRIAICMLYGGEWVSPLCPSPPWILHPGFLHENTGRQVVIHTHADTLYIYIASMYIDFVLSARGSYKTVVIYTLNVR